MPAGSRRCSARNRRASSFASAFAEASADRPAGRSRESGEPGTRVYASKKVRRWIGALSRGNPRPRERFASARSPGVFHPSRRLGHQSMRSIDWLFLLRSAAWRSQAEGRAGRCVHQRVPVRTPALFTRASAHLRYLRLQRGSPTLATSIALEGSAFSVRFSKRPASRRGGKAHAFHALSHRFTSARTGYRLLSSVKRWNQYTAGAEGVDRFLKNLARAREPGRSPARSRELQCCGAFPDRPEVR